MNSEIRLTKIHQRYRFGVWSWAQLLCLGFGIWNFSPNPANGQARSNLPASRYLHGEQTLQAFAPLSKATRDSIVKFNVDGETVVLGTVIDTNGLVLTKASEIRPGRLTCWLANEQEVAATVLATDEDEDVALVHVKAKNLRPIQWSTNQVAIGQWAITPGIAATPQAVGIISALPRRIRPQRALLGVRFATSNGAPRIEALLPGMGAEKAGLKPEDIILAVDGEAMTNRAQMVEMLRDYRDGRTVKLRVERSGSPFEADVQMKVPKPEDLGADSEPRNVSLNGEVSRRAEGFEQAIEHASVLPPWLCGGPLVNLEGKAIGLNIARASRVSTYSLPSKFVQDVIKKLLAKTKTQV
jgi:serine protease Do